MLVSVNVGIGVAVTVLAIDVGLVTVLPVGVALVTVLAIGVGRATGVQAARTNKQTSVISFACDLMVPPSMPMTGFLKAPNGRVQPLAFRCASCK